MKTVMKKMFCLMLVAVLMVGVMPFHAFAVEGEGSGDDNHCDTCAANGYTADGHEDTDAHCTRCGNQYGHTADDEHCATCGWYGGHDHNTCTDGCDKSAACTWEHKHHDDCVSKATCIYCGAVGQHLSANCPKTCSKCGNQTGHDETDEHCPICGWYGGHNHEDCTYGCDKTADCAWEHKHHDDCVTRADCQYCEEDGKHVSANCPTLCQTCKAAGTNTNAHSAADHCEQCNVAPGTAPENHALSCTVNPGYHTVCDTCKDRYITANGHPECAVCENVNTGEAGSCHATADCPYCAVCWEDGDQVRTHETSEHCAECDTVNGHASTCSNYTYPETGSHSLKVWARIWIHEKEHKTILLDTIDNLSGGAKIYQVVSANIDRLESKFPAGYHAIHWYENVYHKNKNNEFVDVGTGLAVGDEDDVYVNLYSAEKLVVVNVHTSKGYGYDLSVRIEGFRVGDTVTYNDVLNAVKKYYNVSSMRIYTYEEMERYIAGKDANKTENIIVTDGDNTYEVFISGSRKGGTYTYIADSSNPKTGDMIFAPAIVMGASLTCLAVLFYLNKKRAY